MSARERYAKQDAEWREIRDAMIAAGKRPSAYQVTLEQRKRMLARGERMVTCEEIFAEQETKLARKLET